jgi:pimeloyl-ACP methyl ester carboxylesterase
VLDLRRVLENAMGRTRNPLYLKTHGTYIPAGDDEALHAVILLVPLALFFALATALVGFGWLASSRAVGPAPGTYDWSPEDYPELAPEEVVLDSGSGARLDGRFYAGATPATIVLLHGYGGNQDELLPLADRLHVSGYSVFTYDQRGCGRSSGVVTFGAREQDDLISVVDYLAERPDVDPLKLGVVGFSMGGATAIMTAAREPRIRAVVADSAWSEVRAWLRPSLEDSFVHPRDPFTALSLKLAELRNGIDLDELRPGDVVDRIAPRPLLLVHGADDVVVPAAEATRNHAAAGEPKRVVLVERAGHGETIVPGGATTSGEASSFFDAAFGLEKEAAA